MRTALLLLAIGWSGCSPPCGGCANFESCDLPSMQCVLNNGARFDFIATTGQISTNGRTILDGAPSPQICVNIGGEVCSTIQELNYYPAWNQTLFPDVDGALLKQSPIAMRYIDKGILNDVSVCNASVTILETYLHDGGFVMNCPNGSDVNFSLKNVARGGGDGGAVDGNSTPSG